MGKNPQSPVPFLVVIPERGYLLLFVALVFFFRVFSPEIACQAPKPPKTRQPTHNKPNIVLAKLEFSYTQPAILKTVEKNKASPVGRESPSGANSFVCPNLAITLLL
jgi:hypothetical protein